MPPVPCRSGGGLARRDHARPLWSGYAEGRSGL